MLQTVSPCALNYSERYFLIFTVFCNYTLGMFQTTSVLGILTNWSINKANEYSAHVTTVNPSLHWLLALKLSNTGEVCEIDWVIPLVEVSHQKQNVSNHRMNSDEIANKGNLKCTMKIMKPWSQKCQKYFNQRWSLTTHKKSSVPLHLFLVLVRVKQSFAVD